MSTMSSPAAPESDPAELMGIESGEPPASERLTKLAGENARLRSEIRQTLARAQRAEADATRVRGSTKFQVGDLLVKAARQPKRLLLLPRDLLRLYRLRGHRRTQPDNATQDTGLGRARRSEYTDEIAARLLLPRIAEQPHRPLSIAGALDPLTAAQWRHVAAVTQVLPHDAATLIHDIDPDIVVIDTAAAGPNGSWSHLGDPAATDRALAARELITAAKANGRPIMLVRSVGDSAGFDSIAASCDLVVDLPGSRESNTWHPGFDLGAVVRVDPSLVRAAAPQRSPEPGQQSATPPAVLIVDSDLGLDPDGAAGLSPAGSTPDSPTAAAWSTLLAAKQIPVTRIDPAAPPVTAVEAAVRDSAVVALSATRRDDVVAGFLPALLALATGRHLVTPDDAQLRTILGLSAHADTRPLGWFPYSPGDVSSARLALDEAISTPQPDLLARWLIWRVIFERAGAAVAWEDAVTRLGLGAQPSSVHRVALIITDPDPDDHSIETLVTAVGDERSPVHEIVCDRRQTQRIQSALERGRSTSVEVIGVSMDTAATAFHNTNRHTIRARAAQACRSPLLLDLHPTVAANPTIDASTISTQDLIDAVIAYELSDAPGHVVIRRSSDGQPSDESVLLSISNRHATLAGILPPAIIVEIPGAMA